MYKYFITFFVLLNNFSCANISNEEYMNEMYSFREKNLEKIIHAGASCNSSCIWSTYAVETGIKDKEAECVEGSCACVKTGDAHTSCEAVFEEDNLSSLNNSSIRVEIPDMIYFNQYDNVNYGYATCQNTSVAMTISYFENQIHPDIIFNRWGKDIAQSPSGLNAVYTHYSKQTTIRTYTNASPEDLIHHLSNGYIAIVHGYFTSYGHVLVVRGYSQEEERYYVNDPAGVWNSCFKCGYSNNYNGVTSYDKVEFEKAVFTSNGYSYLPGWIHIVK